MTDLQVRYWQLQEEKRANQAQEALKSRDLNSQESLRYSQVQLNSAQTQKVEQETRNLQEEIKLIQARTDLTEQQKKTEVAKTVQNWTDAIVGILDPFGIGRSIGQGLGSGLGKGIGSAAGAALFA